MFGLDRQVYEIVWDYIRSKGENPKKLNVRELQIVLKERRREHCFDSAVNTLKNCGFLNETRYRKFKLDRVSGDISITYFGLYGKVS